MCGCRVNVVNMLKRAPQRKLVRFESRPVGGRLRCSPPTNAAGFASSPLRYQPRWRGGGLAQTCMQACGFPYLGYVLVNTSAESGSPKTRCCTILVGAWRGFIKVFSGLPALNKGVCMLREDFVSWPRDDARRVPFGGLCLLCHGYWEMKSGFGGASIHELC